jgi:hypothetical protein
LIYTRTGAYAEGRVAEAEVTELFDEHEIATRVEELAGMAVDRGAAEAKLIALACSPFTCHLKGFHHPRPFGTRSGVIAGV